MPPQKISTINNSENGASSFLQKEPSKEFLGMEEKKSAVVEKGGSPKNKLDKLGNTLSKNPFEMFTRQREMAQIPIIIPKPIDNKPTHIQELIKNRYLDYPIKALRTYRGDVEESIQNKKTSIVSIAIAQQKHREEEENEKTAAKREVPQNAVAIVLSAILVITGIGSLFIFLYAKYEQERAVVTLYERTIIPADASEHLVLASQTREETIATIRERVAATEEKIGSIVYFNFFEKETGVSVSLKATTLLSFISPSIPPYLERSFEKDYMFGLYVSAQNEPFLILKTNSFETAFSGMLSWEDTIIDELGNLFIKDTTLLAETDKKGNFKDRIIKNKDARIVKDVNGNTVLLYSFLDKETILITTQEEVFVEIFRRYLNSKLVR